MIDSLRLTRFPRRTGSHFAGKRYGYLSNRRASANRIQVSGGRAVFALLLPQD
jgi:hypothetical protein